MRRAVQVTVATLGLLTLVGLIVLWPSEDIPTTPTGAYAAGVVVESVPCDPPADDCAHILVEVAEGPDAGTQIETDLLISSTSPPIEPGTGVWLTQSSPGEYGFADIRRDGGLIWLVVVFAVAVIVFARWKGVAALAGLASTLVLLAWFVLPALLLGSDPVAVAATGAAAIAIVSMGFAHGFSVRTGVALIGTIIALFVTFGLGTLFTGLTHLTGMGSEDAYFLQLQGATLDLRGLFLAGVVIGAL
ncbi:MAG: YibE/F family protein, partial [Actinomycetota bacterium]|nr:YibE/F family protein [Actinomycetota bacterium]